MVVDYYKIFMGLANMIILGKRLPILCRELQPRISPFHARHKAEVGDGKEKQTLNTKVHPMTWMKWVFGTPGFSCPPVPAALCSPIFYESYTFHSLPSRSLPWLAVRCNHGCPSQEKLLFIFPDAFLKTPLNKSPEKTFHLLAVC